MQKVILDLLPGGVAPIVYASQYDDGRSIRFMLTEGGPDSQYSLNGNETITADLTKPDGTEATINVANPGAGKHYVDLVNGADDYDQAGVYLGEIVLTRNATVIGSANFVLKVEEDAYGGQITTDTATGNPCTFTTDLADALVSLTADVVAIQSGSGTPYPAGGGKNKFGGQYNEITPLFIASGTDIVASAAKASGNINCRYYDENQNEIDFWYLANDYGSNRVWRTFTITQDCYYVKFDGTTTTDMQIEYGTTPTPYAPYSNIRPIVGHSALNLTRCGKNLLSWSKASDTINGIIYTVNSDGTVTADGTATAESTFVLFGATGKFNKPISYIMNGSVGGFGNAVRMRFGVSGVGSYDDFGSGVTIPAIPDLATRYQYIQITIANGTHVDNIIFKPMVRLASETSSEYEPYNGTPYTVAFGQTVYGGVYDKSGRLTITHALLDNSRITEVQPTSGIEYRFNFNVIPDGLTGTQPVICSVFDGSAPYSIYYPFRMTMAQGRHIYFTAENMTTTELLNLCQSSAFQLVYPLATPIVIDVSSISPSAVEGTNNIISDGGGDVAVTYIKKV